jgi:hypothetical protein
MLAKTETTVRLICKVGKPADSPNAAALAAERAWSTGPGNQSQHQSRRPRATVMQGPVLA